MWPIYSNYFHIKKSEALIFPTLFIKEKGDERKDLAENTLSCSYCAQFFLGQISG
jgi:hypothetical protein